MSPTRFFVLAAALCSVGPVSAAPLVIPLPPHAISAPPAASPLGSPLLGQWHDSSRLMLPPGITPFETVSDTLTFRADGTWTQTIEKATGRLQTRGSYTVTGARLTLSFLAGTGTAQYEFLRIGDHLQLQSVALGKPTVLTLSR